MGELYKINLRAPVHSRADEVWVMRNDTDVYTGASRDVTLAAKCEVDHLLEVQLVEYVFACAAYRAAPATPIGAGRSGAVTRSMSKTASPSFGVLQCEELFRESINATSNLNCTSSRVNQAKRGPFTSALNRLRSNRLRDVTLEQLARQGRARWLVDNGTWAKIETEVVKSYDVLYETIDNAPSIPDGGALGRMILEDVSHVFSKLELF